MECLFKNVIGWNVYASCVTSRHGSKVLLVVSNHECTAHDYHMVSNDVIVDMISANSDKIITGAPPEINHKMNIYSSKGM